MSHLIPVDDFSLAITEDDPKYSRPKCYHLPPPAPPRRHSRVHPPSSKMNCTDDGNILRLSLHRGRISYAGVDDLRGQLREFLQEHQSTVKTMSFHDLSSQWGENETEAMQVQRIILPVLQDYCHLIHSINLGAVRAPVILTTLASHLKRIELCPCTPTTLRHIAATSFPVLQAIKLSSRRFEMMDMEQIQITPSILTQCSDTLEVFEISSHNIHNETFSALINGLCAKLLQAKPPSIHDTQKVKSLDRLSLQFGVLGRPLGISSDVLCRQLAKLVRYCSKWRHAADICDFTPDELRAIGEIPLGQVDDSWLPSQTYLALEFSGIELKEEDDNKPWLDEFMKAIEFYGSPQELRFGAIAPSIAKRLLQSICTNNCPSGGSNSFGIRSLELFGTGMQSQNSFTSELVSWLPKCKTVEHLNLQNTRLRAWGRQWNEEQWNRVRTAMSQNISLRRFSASLLVDQRQGEVDAIFQRNKVIDQTKYLLQKTVPTQGTPPLPLGIWAYAISFLGKRAKKCQGEYSPLFLILSSYLYLPLSSTKQGGQARHHYKQPHSPAKRPKSVRWSSFGGV